MSHLERRELAERIGKSVDRLGLFERIHPPELFVEFERGILRRLTGQLACRIEDPRRGWWFELKDGAPM